MSSFPDSTPSDDTITIPLTRGYEAIVDAVDADLAEMRWQFRPTTHTIHVKRTIPKNGVKHSVYLHRVILERVIGRPLLTAEQVDHINGNGLDNRRENLRVANKMQNQYNSARQHNNRLGLKGVHKNGRRYRAQIRADGVKHNLGYFDTAEEAHAAYCEAAKRLHGEFARFE